MERVKIIVRRKGGPGSGNWNHKGRPGMVGGSSIGGGNSVEDYTIRGADLGTLYHGGKRKLTSIDPEKLQSRDLGFYGRGFYTSTNPEFVKFYGSKITSLELDPNAKVLKVGGLTRDKAPHSLVAAAKKAYIDRVVGLRGEEFRERAETSFEDMSRSPTQWPSIINIFAESAGYDVVMFSNGEIIIKNLQSIRSLQ